jgi:hypothetical protein
MSQKFIEYLKSTSLTFGKLGSHIKMVVTRLA